MAIEFVCPACGGTLRVGDESAGRVIRCGGCMSALRVPADAAAEPAPAPDPAADPYANGRAYPHPAPPPPPPARRSSAPTDVDPLPDEAPAAARPVAPRPRDEDRRARRRRPPPPAGYGVFFWLVLIGAVMFIGVAGCCGGFFLLAPDAKWQEHESKDGGFKVELPGKATKDVAKASGLPLEPGTSAEGMVLLRRATKFLVAYRDIGPRKERNGRTDEQLLDEKAQKLQDAMGVKNLMRTTPVTVGGFPGREIAFEAKTGFHTARVIVAETRVYVLLAGGGMAQPDDPDVRRFIDSFEITSPDLVKAGKERAKQAKVVEDAVQAARDRGARAREREAEDIRDAGEAVAEEALEVALEVALAARPPAPPPVAPAPRPVPDVAPPPRPVEE